MDQIKEHILNFREPLDSKLLDQLLLIAMDPHHPQRLKADQLLIELKSNSHMWKRAAAIIDNSEQPTGRFYGLQILTEAITTHWKIIPLDHREGIRSFIVTKILTISNDEALLKKNDNKNFLKHLNLVLIQIVKQDWPENWPTFLTDLVNSSHSSESICENNLKIIQLLTEEIFEFHADSLTREKSLALQKYLMQEFNSIYELCHFILTASARPSLITTTLVTLQKFLTWLPSQNEFRYIFDTDLLPLLVNNFLPNPAFRNAALNCLIEIANIGNETSYREILFRDYSMHIQNFFIKFIAVLNSFLNFNLNLDEIYNKSNETDQNFIIRLAYFLSTFMTNFLTLFYNPTTYTYNEQESIINILNFMINLSNISDENIFKTCLDFWHNFSLNLHSAYHNYNLNTPENYITPLWDNSSNNGFPIKSVLKDTLNSLRYVIINHMVKPEEVIVVEDENGEIIREQTKDTESLAQYKTTRDTLIYLTHLDYSATETILLEKLDQQVAKGQFSWNGINTLCWAIGSISGSMKERDEKRFLVTVIKDLLKLCEEQKGKSNKAVVASNIMYIVGQYPRFLRAHWRFLKTVVNKLFEFMHESHPGVQDMACDTFLKIVQKCKRKFVIHYPDEPEPFLIYLINSLDKHIQDLQLHQVLTFYECIGTMLSEYQYIDPKFTGPTPNSVTSSPSTDLITKLFYKLNVTWMNRMSEASNNIEELFTVPMMKELSKIIKINIKIALTSGSIYFQQFLLIFNDLLNIYRAYRQKLNFYIEKNGIIIINSNNIKLIRNIKQDIVELFISSLLCLNTLTDSKINTEELKKVYYKKILSNITLELLNDFVSSIDLIKNRKILKYFSVVIISLSSKLNYSLINRILYIILSNSLNMITVNMYDYPEYRVEFFNFLYYCNKYYPNNFFFILSPVNQKNFIYLIIWAIKHTDRNIAEIGIEILDDLLNSIIKFQSNSNSQLSTGGFGLINPGYEHEKNPTLQVRTNFNSNEIFFKKQNFYLCYFLTLVNDLFEVLTDRLHQFNFLYHCIVLQKLIHILLTNEIQIILNPSYYPSDQIKAFLSINNNNSEETSWMNNITPEDFAENPSLNNLNDKFFVDESNFTTFTNNLSQIEVDKLNKEYLYDSIGNLLLNLLPKLNKNKIVNLLNNILQLNITKDLFKQYIKDFLILSRELDQVEEEIYPEGDVENEEERKKLDSIYDSAEFENERRLAREKMRDNDIENIFFHKNPEELDENYYKEHDENY